VKSILGRWLLILVCTSTVAGCMHVKQLNRISFVTAIGIDKGASGVKVHALIAVPGKFAALSPGGEGGAEEKNPNYILSEEGADITEALFKMKRASARDMGFGHVRLILFSDELAREGVEPYLDIFMRREEFQLISWIAIAKGSTKDILLAKPQVPQSVTDYLTDVLSQSGSDSMEILPIYLYQFYSYSHEPGKTPYAMEIELNKGGNQLRLTKLGLFRYGKLVGELTPKETKYLQLISGQRLKSASITTMNKSYTILRHRVKSRVSKDGIHSTMNLTLELDNNPAGNPMPVQELRKLQSEIAETVQEDIKALIRKLQSLKTDPAGFGEKYRLALGGYLSAEEWLERIFPEMPVRVEVNVGIERKGMIT